MPRPQYGMTDSHRTDSPRPLDEYIAAIVQCGGPLTSIVAHLEQHGGAGAPVSTVLTGLLSSVLTPLQETHSEEQPQVAAAILHETTDIVCREILLVPDAPNGGNRAQRRRRRPQ